jgi:glutamine phosphoribosylpyrophosphate amidotransferase
MCGLVGYIGLGKKPNFAKNLLIAAQMRGVDATGYIEISQNGDFLLKKQNVRASIATRGFGLYLNQTCSFLGHTRRTSCGANGPNQAHPYIGQRFLLMHNGWFRPHERLRLEVLFNINCPNGVDSEMFLSYLEKTSINDLRDVFLPEISPVYARYMLVIYDKVLKQLHFMKDAAQVFCWKKLETGGVIYGSTPEILQKADKTLVNLEEYPNLTHFVIDAITGSVISSHKIPHTGVVFNAGVGV